MSSRACGDKSPMGEGAPERSQPGHAQISGDGRARRAHVTRAIRLGEALADVPALGRFLDTIRLLND
jgi:hypothetical protein